MVKLIDFTKLPLEFGGTEAKPADYRAVFTNVVTTAIAANHPQSDLVTLGQFYSLITKVQSSENLLELDERELDLLHKELQDCKAYPISLLMSAPVVAKAVSDLKYKKGEGGD